jgi:DNA polymerase family A
MLPQYSGLIVWDFEYRPDADHRPSPVCATFLELRSGRRVELWGDERRGDFGSAPPFPVDRDWLWVSYHASAETGCHLALGWLVPETILDLEAEFRCSTTNYHMPAGKGLPGAMQAHGLSWSDTLEKPAMRDLILRGGPYTLEQQRQILDYCWLDTDGTAALLECLVPAILARPNGWALALLRGHYSGHCIAYMEHRGVPLDRETYVRLDRHWNAIRHCLVAEYDPQYQIYQGLRFVTDRFADYLAREDIPWPVHESGVLDLRDETFKQMGELYPQVEPLRLLRHTLGKLRLTSITLGADDRNRCMLGQFVASTGRNAHQAGRFIYGPSRWLRNLIKPPRGRALAYLDWSAQEFVIAAGLSGDQHMLAAIASGDPYMWFARVARLAPDWATKETYPHVREVCKRCCLGVLYGMGRRALAFCTRRSEFEARDLLERHRRIFPTFWAWSGRAVHEATLIGHIDLAFGWRIHDGIKADGDDTSPTTLMNAPMQGNGAEMLRLAACFAHRAGIAINAPLHDAFLIEAPAGEIDDATATMAAAMNRASRAVLDGVEVDVAAKLIAWPDRYVDDRVEAKDMWRTAMGHLTAIERAEREGSSAVKTNLVIGDAGGLHS